MEESIISAANLKDILGVGVGGLAIASVAGYGPRIGLGRAMTLHLKSFFQTTSPISVRKTEISNLKMKLATLGKGCYIVISGGVGNGKTCLINTTLNREFGVVKISVSLRISLQLLNDSFKLLSCL
jgi:hypothetical protein